MNLLLWISSATALGIALVLCALELRAWSRSPAAGWVEYGPASLTALVLAHLAFLAALVAFVLSGLSAMAPLVVALGLLPVLLGMRLLRQSRQRSAFGAQAAGPAAGARAMEHPQR
jgi:isoprenylcysteine carboxyl methyltransferase (ICMT) family protein YpbQ